MLKKSFNLSKSTCRGICSQLHCQITSPMVRFSKTRSTPKRILSVNFSTSLIKECYTKDDSFLDRGIPRSIEEEGKSLFTEPEYTDNPKVLKVAVIGVPNSGKSTLINQLVKWKVCNVSKKVHTTVCNSKAVFSEGDTQIIFLDTPGVVGNEMALRQNLKESMIIDPEKALQDADLIAVLHTLESRLYRNSLHPIMLKLLAFHARIPSILILNKIDLIDEKLKLLNITNTLTLGLVGGMKISPIIKKKESDKSLTSRLLGEDLHQNCENESEDKLEEYSSCIQVGADKFTDEDIYEGRIELTEGQVNHFIKDKVGWPKFQEIFMVSALKGDGVDDVRAYLKNCAEPGPWLFTGDAVTDRSPQEIAIMTVREKCLEFLKFNIPYELKFKLDNWQFSAAEVLHIGISVHCHNKGPIHILIGKGGRKAQQIAASSEQELRTAFRTEVKLVLCMKEDKTLKKKPAKKKSKR